MTISITSWKHSKLEPENKLNLNEKQLRLAEKEFNKKWTIQQESLFFKGEYDYLLPPDVVEFKKNKPLIAGSINYVLKYLFLYGKNKNDFEYEISNHIKFYFENFSLKDEDKYGETRIKLQEYLGKNILISGQVINVRSKNGYINKICLAFPKFQFECNINNLSKELLKYKEKLKTDKFIKNFTHKSSPFATHVWVNLNEDINIDKLYLGTTLFVYGTVNCYKGKIKEHNLITIKYSINNSGIISQSGFFTTFKNTNENPDNEYFNLRTKKMFQEIPANKCFYVDCDNWSDEYTVGKKENGKLMFNQKTYKFLTNKEQKENPFDKSNQILIDLHKDYKRKYEEWESILDGMKKMKESGLMAKMENQFNSIFKGKN